MPDSHTTRTIAIGIKPQTTVSAVEVGLRDTRTDMQTTRTTFGSICLLAMMLKDEATCLYKVLLPHVPFHVIDNPSGQDNVPAHIAKSRVFSFNADSIVSGVKGHRDFGVKAKSILLLIQVVQILHVNIHGLALFVASVLCSMKQIAESIFRITSIPSSGLCSITLVADVVDIPACFGSGGLLGTKESYRQCFATTLTGFHYCGGMSRFYVPLFTTDRTVFDFANFTFHSCEVYYYSRPKSRVNSGDFNACDRRLIFHKLTQLIKRPTVQMFRHKPFSASAYARQIFQDDALIVRTGYRDDCFADAVIRVSDKSILASRDTPQHALGGATIMKKIDLQAVYIYTARQINALEEKTMQPSPVIKSQGESILREFDSGGISAAALSRKYGVAPQTIRSFLIKNSRKAVRLFDTKPCRISKLDAAYIAGFIDGEGCIFARRTKSRNTESVACGIAFSLTDHALLLQLQGLTGLGNVGKRPAPKNSAWKEQWYWEIPSQQSVKLLGVVLPFLKMKRRQGELLLELAGLKRKSTTKGQFNMERQLEIQAEMQLLNRRGRAIDV